MKRLALARAVFGIVALSAPDELSGHLGDLRLDDGTRRAVRILGVRLLAEAAICSVRPTRCVLTLEAVVDAIHATTMGAVAVLSRDDNRRRAARANVLSAAAFTVADLVAVREHRPAREPAPNSVLRLRDSVAERLCHASRLAQCL